MPPVLFVLLRPLRERLLERAEPEEEGLRLLRDRRRPVGLASRVDQLERIKAFPTVLALVPARPREAAVGTRPLDIPVREEPLVRPADRGAHQRRVDVARLLTRA